MLAKLQGYRTIISIAISLALKILVLKGVIRAEANTAENANLATDALLLLVSGVCDLAGVWFKLKSPAPGLLSPEGKAHREWVKYGKDRRSPDQDQPADKGN